MAFRKLSSILSDVWEDIQKSHDEQNYGCRKHPATVKFEDNQRNDCYEQAGNDQNESRVIDDERRL